MILTMIDVLMACNIFFNVLKNCLDRESQNLETTFKNE